MHAAVHEWLPKRSAEVLQSDSLRSASLPYVNLKAELWKSRGMMIVCTFHPDRWWGSSSLLGAPLNCIPAKTT